MPLTTYSYNAANLVISLENKKADQILSSFRYTYNLDGNQKDKTEQDGTVTGYLYDSMGRLRQESETGGKTISYTYDRFSNRAKMSVSGTESYETSYTYHPNNWLLTEEKRQGDTVETTRYRYDANGNQVYREWEKVSPEETETGTMKFVSDAFQEDVATLETREYNGFNEPVSVCRDGVRIAYRYRPDGLRYGKTIRERNGETSSTIHLWDGQNIVAEVGTTGSVTARYLRGVNLIAREQDGANQYYLLNAHGDVIQRADAWGNVLKAYRYDAFGNEQNPEKLDSNPFRYCGEYFDKETGEIYLRARYYDPATSRMLSEDTHWNPNNMIYGDNPVVIGTYQDTLGLNVYTYAPDINAIKQSSNLYVYCMNNPTMYLDATGKNAAVAGEILKWGWTAAGTSALADSPLPGPGDALGLIIGAGATLIAGGVYVVGYFSDKAVNDAYSFMSFASTAATPPPPNDPNGKGTQTTSKTLYNKKGTHLDVENPGNRPGQIHLQQNGTKYYYNVQDQTFRIGSSAGKMAPNSIQNLLKNPQIVKAVAKGLRILGY